jgi:hypothetical protein
MPNDRQVRLKPPPLQQPVYEVGYGKPPAVARFKPGRSGNPARGQLRSQQLFTALISETERANKALAK